MLYEPTAWYSYFQFSDIFSRLSNIDEYERILFQFELWKARGRVPAAIHATSLLLNVIVCDKNSHLHESSLSNLYAITIIRTVNLLLDQEQDSLYAKSMMLMGKEANIPEDVIKYRHRCSHGDIPELDNLRIVCGEAFNYVYKKYWTSQFNIVNSRLNNDCHFTLLLFSIFLLSRSGIDIDRNPGSHKPHSLTRGLVKYRLNVKERTVTDGETGPEIAHFNKLMGLIRVKNNLSMGRQLDVCGKRLSKNENRSSISIYIGTLKKVINSCIHEDIFLSVFVEYVFCNSHPSQSHMFLLMLFYTLSQYSFNFTVKLISHMLNFMFNISDMFTKVNDSERYSILRRVNSYYKMLINFSNLDKNSIKYKNGEDFVNCNVNSNKYKNNVNEWLLMLIQYANCLKNKQFCKNHLYYLKMIKGLSYVDYTNMLNHESTALSRILMCVKSILPLYIPKLESGANKINVNDWMNDKLSHIICIIDLLNNSVPQYTLVAADEEKKRKIVQDSNNSCKESIMNINKMLMPGTFWNNNEFRIAQTYPLDGLDNVPLNDKITNSFRKILGYELFKRNPKDKKILKVQTQLYNINQRLELGDKDKIRIQKKLFRAISYAMYIFKSEM